MPTWGWGYIQTNPDIFESAYFLPRLLWTGPSTALESFFKSMQFQWADSLVLCGRKADLCEKVCSFKNIQICVEVA